MRWIIFLILTYLALVLQTTLVPVVTVTLFGLRAGPELLAVFAVFVALHVREGTDAMVAGWILGLAVDLTSAGGAVTATVVGPMSIAYAVAAGGVYRARELFFRERRMTQFILALGFCLFSHWLWVTLQSLRAGGISRSAYGQLLLQVLLVSLYTAAVMPLASIGLVRLQRWIIAAPTTRRRPR